MTKPASTHNSLKYRLRRRFLAILALIFRPALRRPPPAIASVLYIKPDHLGDLLLATPVLAALRQRFPSAQITALVGPWSRMVLERSADIDVLLVCPFPGFTRATQDRRGVAARLPALVAWSVLQPYVLLLHYALLLRAGRYDLAIVGRDDHWWGAALALLAGVPYRVGFAVPECRPFLSQALPWDAHAHVTAQGLELVAAAAQIGQWAQPGALRDTRAAVRQGPYDARFDPSGEDIAWAQRWVEQQKLASQPLVLIHPGTGGPAKLWRAERWSAVADALQTAGVAVVLTGGPGEEALVAQVAAGMRAHVLQLAGQTSVGQLAALMRRAALVLGVDSGPLHLAAAQGVATLHLYGPGDERRFGPWGDEQRHVVLRVALWCSPCGVFSACPRGLAQPECMESIGAAPVVDQALRMLAESIAPGQRAAGADGPRRTA